MQANNATLIGIGNLFMRDEGAGIHAIQYILDNFVIPSELEIVDGGTSGLDLLPYIEDRTHVFFADAVNFNQRPGYIGVLTNQQVPALFGAKASLHHVGLMDVLATARLLERPPKQICLIGIQPDSMETGLELTETIQERLELFVNQIIAQIASQGIMIDKRCPK